MRDIDSHVPYAKEAWNASVHPGRGTSQSYCDAYPTSYDLFLLAFLPTTTLALLSGVSVLRHTELGVLWAVPHTHHSQNLCIWGLYSNVI